MFEAVATVFGFPAKVNGRSMLPTLKEPKPKPSTQADLHEKTEFKLIRNVIPYLPDLHNHFTSACAELPALLKETECTSDWVYVNCWAIQRIGQESKNIAIGDLGK